MEQKEFNLSEKIVGMPNEWADDIKEFIKRAREILSNCISGGCDEELILSNFDKLAGKKLI